MQNTKSKSYHVMIDLNELTESELRGLFLVLSGKRWVELKEGEFPEQDTERDDLHFAVHNATAATLAGDALDGVLAFPGREAGMATLKEVQTARDDA